VLTIRWFYYTIVTKSVYEIGFVNRLYQVTMPVTMDDVAKLSGVSKTTVSRIINNIPNRTSEETKKRVLKTIDELGYFPNQVAASLKRTTTNTIGMILGDIENPFFAVMVKGIEGVLQRSGYSLILANSNYDLEREAELLKILVSKQVDGILIAPSGASSLNDFKYIFENNIQIVFVDNALPNSQFDTVVVNNYQAAYQACEYLISLGHSKISMIAGPKNRMTSNNRTAGFVDCMSSHFGTIDPRYLKFSDYTTIGGYQNMMHLLLLTNPPQAVFVANNLMTVGALGAINESGLNIPKNISIIGFDDMYWYSFNHPALTAINQPVLEIGKAAAERLLLRLSNNEDLSPEVITLDAELVIRESTAPPANRNGNTA